MFYLQTNGNIVLIIIILVYEYNNINNNVSRKDGRDGMNNKMDDLKFQRFENQDIP